MAASVSTRVVSWKLAAEMKESVEGDALVMPSNIALPCAGRRAAEGLQMLVVDVDALQAVDFLNLVDQVLLEFLFTEHGQDVVRIARTIHQGFAGLDLLAFLNLDMDAAGQRVFALFAVLAFHVDLALALADFAVFHRAVDRSE